MYIPITMILLHTNK